MLDSMRPSFGRKIVFHKTTTFVIKNKYYKESKTHLAVGLNASDSPVGRN